MMVVALVAAAVPALASAATFVPEDEARLVGLTGPVFSPDGKRIALIRTDQDVAADTAHTTLIAVGVAGGAPQALTHGREGITQPQYSPDGTLVAYLAFDAKHKRQIEVVPAGGGEPRAVSAAPHGVQQFAWRPDGRALVYVTADDAPAAIAAHHDFFEVGNDDYLSRGADPPAHLWLIGADGSGARRLTAGDWSVAPPSGPAPVLSWSPDGKRLIFLRVRNTHEGSAYLSEVAVLDPASGAVRSLTDRHELETFAAVSPDGRRVAYLAARGEDANDESDVFLTGPGGGRGTDISAKLDRNVYRALWVDAHTLLVGAHDGLNQALWLLRDDGSARRVETGAAQPNQGGWLHAAVGPHGALAYTAVTADHPTELWYQPDARTAPRRLTDINAAVGALRPAKLQAVTWNSDGWVQNGTLAYPPDYSPGRKYPLVLVIHGGPQSAATLAYGGLTQALAARGMLVFEPNYRGSDNGGSAYQRAIYMDAGDGPGRDVMAGLAAVEKLGVVDESRIAVSGWDYGGTLTAWLMTHYHPWRTALSGGAVYDFADAYDLSDTGIATAFGFHGSPHVDANGNDYRAQSPLTYALGVTCPVVLVHDVGDPHAPVSGAMRMYRTLRDNGKQVRFVAIPVDGHGPTDIVRRIDREKLWVDWAADGLR